MDGHLSCFLLVKYLLCFHQTLKIAMSCAPCSHGTNVRTQSLVKPHLHALHYDCQPYAPLPASQRRILWNNKARPLDSSQAASSDTSLLGDTVRAQPSASRTLLLAGRCSSTGMSKGDDQARPLDLIQAVSACTALLGTTWACASSMPSAGLVLRAARCCSRASRSYVMPSAAMQGSSMMRCI